MLDSFLKISDIRDLLQPFVEVENKLLNRRMTKFVKVSEQHNLEDLCNHTTLINYNTLLNILEGPLAANIEPQQPIDLKFRQSFRECSNS